MSSNVDNRIVQMKFDNKQFESGIQTSVKSLENLKKGLNLEESARSLSNLDKIGRAFTLEGIAANVDMLASKFSTLGIMGMTALVNITNSALEAGKALVKSLTIAPISDGFADYGRKLTSIQTITNATGKSIKEVDVYFDQLDTYADKTIYNLDDMTSAMAKFTNAGVSLDQSIPAIKGIANMTAVAGQDAGAAQIAFYNLSQSISGGFLTTTDYKSLNLANIATKEWKEQMIQGAISAGTLKKNSKGMYLIKGAKAAVTDAQLFNEELSKGWASTKVLLDVLGKYGDETTEIGKKSLGAAQDIKSYSMMMETLKASVGTGWTGTFEILIGNLEESKALFTPLTNVIGEFISATSKARNEMLGMWKENGGRTALIEGLVNVFKGLQSIMKPIGEAFREIFPATSGVRLAELTKSFRDLTAKFKIGAETAAAIKFTFKGLFAVLSIGVKAFKLVAGAVGLLIQTLVPGTTNILAITSSIGGFLVYVNEMIEKSGFMNVAFEQMSIGFMKAKEFISKALKEFGPTIDKIVPVIKDIATKLKEAFNSLFGANKVFAAGMTETTDALAEGESGANKFWTALDKIRDVFSKILAVVVPIVKTIAKTIAKYLFPVFESIKKKFDEFSMTDIGAILTGVGLLKIAKVAGNFADILENFSGVIEQVGNTLKAFQKKVKAQALLNVAIALGILAAALVALSFIKMEDLAKSLGILTVVFAELVAGLIVLNKTTKSMKMVKIAGQLIGLGVAILLLTKSIQILSSIDPDRLIQGVGALATLMGVLVLFIKLTKGGDLAASAGGLIAFSTGLLILTGALAILGGLDPARLDQGTKSIATLMVGIMMFIRMTKGGDLATSAGGLMGFATGILILTGALAILGGMDPAILEQGAKSIGTMMMAIMLFIKMTKGGDLAASAGGLMGFATGILILTGAISILGKMDPDKLIMGGIAIRLLMKIISQFINTTRGGDLVASAGGLIAFSIGITILVGALVILSRLNPDRLVQGGMAIAVLMKVIATFITLTSGGDLKKSASGLMGFAIGLMVLSGAVAILSAIKSDRIDQGIKSLMLLMVSIATFVALTKEGDLEKSAKGLIGFSTGLMILAGVVAILSALNTDKIMMASVAISALIMTIAAFVKITKEGDLGKSALGLTAFAVGIGVISLALIAIGQMDTNKIITAGSAITVLLWSIIGFVKLTKGSDLVSSAGGLVIFTGALWVLSKVIIALGSVDMKTLLVGIGTLITMLTIVGVSASVLSKLAPQILILSTTLVIFGAACLGVGLGMLLFAKGMTELAASGGAAVGVLVNVITGIIGLIPLAATTLALGIINFAKTIGEGAPIISTSFMLVLGGIITAIITMTPQILNCIAVLITSFLDLLVATVPKMVDSGAKLIIGILDGISSNLPRIIDSAFRVITSFINGLADAIRGNNQPIYSACRNLITAIIEAITNMIPNLVGAGSDMVRGLIKGVTNMKGSVGEAMKGIANGAVDGLKKLLGIHSPSRVFAEIGKYSMEGFAGGMNKFSGLASTEAENAGSSAMSILRKAMSGLSDAVNGSVDMNPTIRPVLDLTDIQNGSKRLNTMMNGYAMSGTIGLANNAAKIIRSNKDASIALSNQTTAQPAQGQQPIQQNTFNITGDNPKQIAEEVSRILQRQVERRSTAWA